MISNRNGSLIELLTEIIRIVDSPETDIVWTKYNSIEELVSEINSYIDSLKIGDESVIKDINFLFAPTGSLQEISISNDWVDKFIGISSVVDDLTK